MCCTLVDVFTHRMCVYRSQTELVYLRSIQNWSHSGAEWWTVNVGFNFPWDVLSQNNAIVLHFVLIGLNAWFWILKWKQNNADIPGGISFNRTISWSPGTNWQPFLKRFVLQNLKCAYLWFSTQGLSPIKGFQRKKIPISEHKLDSPILRKHWPDEIPCEERSSKYKINHYKSTLPNNYN